MLTLFFAPGSSSMAPHIALHELGVPFERRDLSFARNQHKDPAYLAIDAEGKVPTLPIDGRPMTEVAGILFYLARAFPEAGLLPVGDIEAEARIVSWMSFIAATAPDGDTSLFPRADPALPAHDGTAVGPPYHRNRGRFGV
jgi:glutathione S-transferase